MQLWSQHKGQTEPLAALAAVFALGIGITAYAGVLDATVEPVARNVAQPTLNNVHEAVTVSGAVDPSALEAGFDAGPTGYDLRITATADGRTWTVGPKSPPGADVASRVVSVRFEPGVVRAGRLRVEVWQ